MLEEILQSINISENNPNITSYVDDFVGLFCRYLGVDKSLLKQTVTLSFYKSYIHNTHVPIDVFHDIQNMQIVYGDSINILNQYQYVLNSLPSYKTSYNYVYLASRRLNEYEKLTVTGVYGWDTPTGLPNEIVNFIINKTNNYTKLLEQNAKYKTDGDLKSVSAGSISLSFADGGANHWSLSDYNNPQNTKQFKDLVKLYSPNITWSY